MTLYCKLKHSYSPLNVNALFFVIADTSVLKVVAIAQVQSHYGADDKLPTSVLSFDVFQWSFKGAKLC